MMMWVFLLLPAMGYYHRYLQTTLAHNFILKINHLSGCFLSLVLQIFLLKPYMNIQLYIKDENKAEQKQLQSDHVFTSLISS